MNILQQIGAGTFLVSVLLPFLLFLTGMISMASLACFALAGTIFVGWTFKPIKWKLLLLTFILYFFGLVFWG